MQSLTTELQLHVGVGFPDPRAEDAKPRLAVLILPSSPSPAVDGSLPYYVPYGARILRWRAKSYSALRGGETLLSLPLQVRVTCVSPALACGFVRVRA